MNNEIRPSQITIDYNGNCANRIDWQTERLALFAKVTDLRTKIIIKDSDDRPQLGIESLGENLIWKKFANPLDFLPVKPLLGEKLRVATNFESGEATIYLNHHVITRDVVQRCKGRIDERLFVEQVNTLVKQGLGNVLAKEKQKQVLSSLYTDAKVGFFGGISYAFFAYRPFSYLIDSLHSMTSIPENHNSLKDFDDIIHYFLGRIIDFGLGSEAFMYTLIFLLRTSLNFIQAGGNEKYIRSFRDLNPISHTQNYLAGRRYLATEGKELVTLLPPDYK